MELKNHKYNFGENIIPFNNVLTNPNSISGKIINIKKNNQELNNIEISLKNVNLNNKTINEELVNNKKIEDFLTKDLTNKITSKNQIHQHNSPKKGIINENLIQKKEKFFEKEEEDLFTLYNKDQHSEDNYTKNLNPKYKKLNINNEEKKEIKINYKSKVNKEKNDVYDEIMKNGNKTNNYVRTFLYNIKDINNNENLINNYISSFFDLTAKHLKEELEHDHSYNLNLNNSYNYVPKYSLELSCNAKRNNDIICKNIKCIQNKNLNFNINPNIFFKEYNQMNTNKNNNKNTVSNENEDNNKVNFLNNYYEIISNNKNEKENKINCEIKQEIERKTQLNEKYINNIQSSFSNNNCCNIYENQYEDQYYQTQQNFSSNFPNFNNIISIDKNKSYLSNNNTINNSKNDNNFSPNKEGLHHFNKSTNYSDTQIYYNSNLINSKININTSEKDLMNLTEYKDLKKNMNGRMNNFNNKQISYQNNNSHCKECIQNNSNNMSVDIYLYNINYNSNYNSYINLMNQNKKQNNKQEEQININNNEIKSLVNNMPINNQINNLNPSNYIIKMFGRFGWICRYCNNFNFAIRDKCNRCNLIKTPKLKVEIFKKKTKKKKKKLIRFS